MKYSVNEEGIQALKSLSNALYSAIEDIASHSSQIRSFSDEYSDTIGPHKSSLDQSAESIIECIRQSADPANDVAERLCEVAEGYQEVIDNDNIYENNTDNSSSVASKGSSFLGRIFGGGTKNNSSGNKFGSFDTGKYKNGDSVVKGDNYEQYMSEYYDSENSTYESLGDNFVVETIPPSKIEGIHLGSTEMEDNGRFWSQHESGGTADSFKEIASHIPEVKAQLDSGKTLSEIRNNPDFICLLLHCHKIMVIIYSLYLLDI